MYLFEHEAKQLLIKAGMQVPASFALLQPTDEVPVVAHPVMVKAQVLAGGRGRAGLVRRVEPDAIALAVAEIRKHRPGAAILIEEAVAIAEEWYVAVAYDTAMRRPLLLWSRQGGVDVEAEANMERMVLDPTATEHGLENLPSALVPIAKKIIGTFFANDARLIEINPLVKTTDGQWVAADAKITLDDDAAFRYPEWAAYPERSLFGRPLTERERAASTIDSGAQGYRGTASKYIELDGDIAVLFSGGGASITCMDALIAAGGAAANYSEYSGNPPRAKVEALARVALSKPGLRGLWIAGGVANFTDIGETLGAIAEVLADVRPQYPIVVRRGGPGTERGRQALERVARECNLRLRFFGPEVTMTETAEVLMDMVRAG